MSGIGAATEHSQRTEKQGSRAKFQHVSLYCPLLSLKERTQCGVKANSVPRPHPRSHLGQRLRPVKYALLSMGGCQDGFEDQPQQNL